MHPLQPYWETIGVLILAAGGMLYGRTTSRWMWPRWLIAYLIPLMGLCAIAVARWIPLLESMIPFRLIMADRAEFALFGFLITSALTIPLMRLPHKRQQVLVNFMMWLMVGLYAVLPFLLPAWNRSHLSGLKTQIDDDGVCLQSNDYTCGPAAAVTALRQLGIQAEEGELAILSHTTQIAGTPGDSLCSAINRRHGSEGIRASIQNFDSISEIKQLPLIAVVKYGFMVDHYVTVLSITDKHVEIGDPLQGKTQMSHLIFLGKWRKTGIHVEKLN